MSDNTVIRFDDGVLVELTSVNRARPVSTSDVSPVARTFRESAKAVGAVIGPLVAGIRDSLEAKASDIEVELGCTFTGEAGIPVICKASTQANITIRIKISGDRDA